MPPWRAVPLTCTSFAGPSSCRHSKTRHEDYLLQVAKPLPPGRRRSKGSSSRAPAELHYPKALARRETLPILSDGRLHQASSQGWIAFWSGPALPPPSEQAPRCPVLDPMRSFGRPSCRPGHSFASAVSFGANGLGGGPRKGSTCLRQAGARRSCYPNSAMTTAVQPIRFRALITSGPFLCF